MRYYGAILAAVLVVWISIFPVFYPPYQTFAQTNESIRILIGDAIEDLQAGHTPTLQFMKIPLTVSEYNIHLTGKN